MNRRFGSCIQALSVAVVLGLLGLATTCPADPNEDVGTAAFPTLKLGVGAATVGRGGAGIALSEDAYATYWNPAGLAHTRATHLALMNNEWILDLRQNDGGYVGNDSQLFTYFAQAPFRGAKLAEARTLMASTCARLDAPERARCSQLLLELGGPR